jgi:hypothetical protein
MGRGPRRGPRGGGDEMHGGGFGQKEETTYVVPADKTGLVIGKGNLYHLVKYQNIWLFPGK